ncbi:MAG TPA: hypothetical protein VK797_12840 [Tepidisphaeraceae bacterium]|jgi:hypothetical protein|nr:hypothetical protein [Tepidisphaeraceae bacterium]
MANNYLEDLAAEWYQFGGYFVRRNVRVGRRKNGGHECELDVVAFHPESKHLVHVEPTMDANSWQKREGRYAKKFEAGRKYIPGLFRGSELPNLPEQIMLIGYGLNSKSRTVAGGRVLTIGELLKQICSELKKRPLLRNAVPESFPLLRGIQIMIENRSVLRDVFLAD